MSHKHPGNPLKNVLNNSEHIPKIRKLTETPKKFRSHFGSQFEALTWAPLFAGYPPWITPLLAIVQGESTTSLFATIAGRLPPRGLQPR